MNTRLSRLSNKFRAFRYRHSITPQPKLLSDTILEDFPNQKVWEKYKRDNNIIVKDIFQYWWTKTIDIPKTAEHTITKIVEQKYRILGAAISIILRCVRPRRSEHSANFKHSYFHQY